MKKELTALAALQQAKGSPTEAAKLLGIPRTSLYMQVVAELRAGHQPVEEKLDIIEEHRLRKANAGLKRTADEALARANELAKQLSVLERVEAIDLDPPEWLIQKPKGRTHRGIITAFLSDTHFDEHVRASEMNGVNAYNRQIADLRLQEFFQGAIKLTRDYIAGIKIDGLVLPLGGDMVSGNIHEELERTNDAPILDTCVYWAGQLAAGIDLLSKFFPKIHIPCVTGNHGRLRKKPQYKQRARDNYDWLIYQMLAREFKHNPRITFTIPDGSDCRYEVYSTRMLLTHGDQFSGGNGIGGIAVPIMRGDAKKQKREAALGRSYDHMLIGHWHQRRNLGSVFINGSLKGYDEYAAGNNFDFEPPQQSMWVTTPERGVTIETPIMVQSKQEKW